MLSIAYEPVAFSQDSGARLGQPDHLRCSWSELVWAAVTVGRSNLRHAVRPETYPYLELLQRSSIIFEHLQAADYRPGLWEPADARVLLSPVYQHLDYADKPRMTAYLRLIMARLFAARLFDLTWLLHAGSYVQDQDVGLPRESCPELVGLNHALHWTTIETKGRSNRLDRRAVRRAKSKATAVGSIAGARPERALVFSSYFTGKNRLLKAYLEDATPDIRADGPGLDLKAGRYLFNYYRLIGEFLASNHGSLSESQNCGPETFVTKPIIECDLKIGLQTEIYEEISVGGPISTARLAKLVADFTPPTEIEERAMIGRDGIYICLGDSWRAEQMSLPPAERG